MVKISHFLSPERISEWEFQPRYRFKLKTGGCSVGAFIEEVLRTNSAELFCSYAFSLNPCLLHSSQTCAAVGMSSERKVFCQELLWVLWGKNWG